MILALSAQKIYHDPVLVREIVENLQVRPGKTYMDCTLGEGGHTEAIFKSCAGNVKIIGLDADPDVLKTSEKRLEQYRDAFSPVNANYADMLRVAHRHSAMKIDGILMDLGMSSFQLEASGRGFSFLKNEPLDMRFTSFEGITAGDVVNDYEEDRLANIIFRFGQEKRSRSIAKAITRNRPITSSLELAKVISYGVHSKKNRIHPATKTFQAIRIEVNNELSNLHLGLIQAIELLVPRGRLAVISYHSLEDKLVKEFLKRESSDCICPVSAPMCKCGHVASIKIINRKVIKPQDVEVMINSRSRSARLRVAERI